MNDRQANITLQSLKVLNLETPVLIRNYLPDGRESGFEVPVAMQFGNARIEDVCRAIGHSHVSGKIQVDEQSIKRPGFIVYLDKVEDRQQPPILSLSDDHLGRRPYRISRNGQVLESNSDLYRQVSDAFDHIPWSVQRPGVRTKLVSVNRRLYSTRYFFCQDCDVVHPDVVIIKLALWALLYPDGGYACQGCIEKRLGRTLAVDDLDAKAACNAELITQLQTTTNPA